MRASVKRDYRSELRSAQARETRGAVVAAAARLFVQDGYGATTVDAISQAAGVSRKTVFTAVGGKLELLKKALDWAIAGDDQPVALADRPETQRLLRDRDGVALLTGWARMQADIDARIAPLFQALEVAAGMDAAARELFEAAQRQRLEGAREVVARLDSLGALAVGLTSDEAVDVAWLASDPVLFDRLVRVRGWSTDRFAEWLAQTLVGQLIGA